MLRRILELMAQPLPSSRELKSWRRSFRMASRLIGNIRARIPQIKLAQMAVALIPEIVLLIKANEEPNAAKATLMPRKAPAPFG